MKKSLTEIFKASTGKIVLATILGLGLLAAPAYAKTPEPSKTEQQTEKPKPIVIMNKAQFLAAIEAKQDMSHVKIMAKTDLSGVDLSGANLRGVDLQGAKLQRVNLQGADLQGAKLQWTNMFGANLTKTNLKEAQLQGVRLHGANLTKANLEKAQMQGVDLQHATLTAANLKRADLSGANLKEAALLKAGLQGAILQGSNLTNTDLSGAFLGSAKLKWALLSGATITYDSDHLNGSDFTGARGIKNTKFITASGDRICDKISINALLRGRLVHPGRFMNPQQEPALCPK